MFVLNKSFVICHLILGVQQWGTNFQYNPPAGLDLMITNGRTNTVNVTLRSITAMPEYENKSLEVCIIYSWLSLFVCLI